jgi:hypothetical protein
VDSSFGVPLRSRVCEVGSWFLGLVALQWLRGLGQLGKSETCVGSRVHLVGLSIFFEKNFLSAPIHSPPPLVRCFGPSSGIRASSGIY